MVCWHANGVIYLCGSLVHRTNRSGEEEQYDAVSAVLQHGGMQLVGLEVLLDRQGPQYL